MAVRETAEAYYERMFPDRPSPFGESDPEFTRLFEDFAFGEVMEEIHLDDRTRMLSTLAVLLGCQGIDEYRAMLPAALELGVTPVEAKEMVYQSVAYLGMGRALPFLRAANEILAARGVALPLEPQGATTPETRYQAGEEAQTAIFGEGMRGFGQSGPEESRHINKWLVDNCFGDYYTRGGLDHREREMITFCFLAAQGGCEPQLMSHIAANLRMGNDKGFLIRIISQNIPFIGYPRSLNALRCVNEAAGQ